MEVSEQNETIENRDMPDDDTFEEKQASATSYVPDEKLAGSGAGRSDPNPGAE